MVKENLKLFITALAFLFLLLGQKAWADGALNEEPKRESVYQWQIRTLELINGRRGGFPLSPQDQERALADLQAASDDSQRREVLTNIITGQYGSSRGQRAYGQ